jgi:hypothetical protein
LKTIYVAGWPRSGTTWLTRLLGDILNCPTGAFMPQFDSQEIATEGQDRPNKDMIIRKGHFRLVEDAGGPIVHPMHKLAYKRLTDNELVVFIVRDPRDIAVSASYYFKQSLEVVLKRMSDNYVEYMNKWLDAPPFYIRVRYEDLLDSIKLTSSLLVAGLGIDLGLPPDDIIFYKECLDQAIDRQSFANRPKDVITRKGIAGDWKNHFSSEMVEFANKHFGEIMKKLGYE